MLYHYHNLFLIFRWNSTISCSHYVQLLLMEAFASTGPSVSYSMSPINQWGMEGLTVEWSSQSVMAVWLSGSWPAELGSWERAWDFHQNLRCHPQPWLSHSCRFSSSDRGCHLPSLEERSCSIHPEVPDDHTKRTKNSVRRICSTAVQVPATTLTN